MYVVKLINRILKRK